MAITVTLNAIDRTAYSDLQSISITDSITANADTLNMEVAEIVGKALDQAMAMAA